MSAIYKFLLNRLVAWFSGLTAEDFMRIVAWVRTMDGTGRSGDGTGPQKAETLRTRISQAWSKLSPSIINWLIETALRLVRKTG